MPDRFRLHATTWHRTASATVQGQQQSKGLLCIGLLQDAKLAPKDSEGLHGVGGELSKKNIIFLVL